MKPIRNPDSAPGEWYIDTACIDCGASRHVAPGLIVIRFDPARLFHEDGRRKELHELDDATRLAVRVEADSDGNLRYKSPDKVAAREQAMKHLGSSRGTTPRSPRSGSTWCTWRALGAWSSIPSP